MNELSLSLSKYDELMPILWRLRASLGAGGIPRYLAALLSLILILFTGLYPTWIYFTSSLKLNLLYSCPLFISIFVDRGDALTIEGIRLPLANAYSCLEELSFRVYYRLAKGGLGVALECVVGGLRKDREEI